MSAAFAPPATDPQGLVADGPDAVLLADQECNAIYRLARLSPAFTAAAGSPPPDRASALPGEPKPEQARAQALAACGEVGRLVGRKAFGRSMAGGQAQQIALASQCHLIGHVVHLDLPYRSEAWMSGRAGSPWGA